MKYQQLGKYLQQYFFLFSVIGFFFWIFYEGIKDRNAEESKWQTLEEFEEWSKNTKMTAQEPKQCCDAHGTRGTPFLFLTNGDFSTQTLQTIKSLAKGSHSLVITDQEEIPPSNTGFIVKNNTQREAKVVFRAFYDALHVPTFISIDPVDILELFEKTSKKVFRARFVDLKSNKIDDAAIENKILFLVIYKRNAIMKDMLDVLNSIEKEKYDSKRYYEGGILLLKYAF